MEFAAAEEDDILDDNKDATPAQPTIKAKLKAGKKHTFKKQKHDFEWQGVPLRKEQNKAYYHAVTIDGDVVSESFPYME